MNIWKKTALLLLLTAGFAACSKDNHSADDNPKGVMTYMDITISLPGTQTKADPEDYNQDGTYAGQDRFETLDIYLQSTNDNSLLERIRFSANLEEFVVSGNTITLSEPFRVPSGSMHMYVVLNDINEVGNTAIKEDALIDIDGLAQTIATANGFQDIILMTGFNTINILSGIDKNAASTGSTELANNFKASVTRTASRVIVTENAAKVVASGNTTWGTISQLTYSVAQGTKKIYWLGKSDYTTYGSDFIPDYDSYLGENEATVLYDYSDLRTPAIIPAKPTDAGGYKELEGKFLFENTHKAGNLATTEYRKGNTAYVVARATFIPSADKLAPGENVAIDGTFYYGHATNMFYGSLSGARDAGNAKISEYKEGKVLYFAWLNPDNVERPLNSPVIRNNIYHINIKGFSNLGHNWNPLFPSTDPSSPNNPDPKPTQPYEPANPPIDPLDPLTPEETYMQIEVSVLEWTSHSYEIEF